MGVWLQVLPLQFADVLAGSLLPGPQSRPPMGSPCSMPLPLSAEWGDSLALVPSVFSWLLIYSGKGVLEL